MIRLLLSDLRHHAGSWAWTAVVALVAASAVAGQFRVAHGAFAAAEAAGDPSMIDGAESVRHHHHWGRLRRRGRSVLHQ